MIVAALYIDPRGPYPKITGVDCWDADRDARKYAGPWPVVVHPPCGAWSSLRHLHRRSDEELAPIAVEQVRTWGGVLEHPAHSLLFRHCSMPEPGELPDGFGVTLAVDQCDFGHVARKSSWIYMVRVDTKRIALPVPSEPTHWCSGSRRAPRGPVPPGIKVCSVRQRRRTPPAFAEWLIALARTVSPKNIENKSVVAQYGLRGGR
jgi:hypothetical protein